MATHDSSRDPGAIAVRVLDDAHMTWVAAEVESEHALRAWFDAAPPQGAGAYAAYHGDRPRRSGGPRPTAAVRADRAAPSARRAAVTTRLSARGLRVA